MKEVDVVGREGTRSTDTHTHQGKEKKIKEIDRYEKRKMDR